MVKIHMYQHDEQGEDSHALTWSKCKARANITVEETYYALGNMAHIHIDSIIAY